MLFFFCFLRDVGSRMVTMLEIRPVSCTMPLARPTVGVNYHTMLRMVIMAPERGFVPNRKKELLISEEGSAFSVLHLHYSTSRDHGAFRQVRDWFCLYSSLTNDSLDS
jgi:hypothetical protein